MFKNLINFFNNKSVKKSCMIDDDCHEKMDRVQINYINTEPKIEPLTFYDMERPVLFFTSVYDLEKLIKKSLIISTELLDKLISINVTNKNALIFYSHAIKYILEDIEYLSRFIDELSKVELLDTIDIIEKTLSCLSELYSVCIILKEDCNDYFASITIHRALDEMIKLIRPYIKVKNEKVDYEEIYKKIYLKNIQNTITNEVGKCENYPKLSVINYIVTMLLREDLREVEDVAEIIRKRRSIPRD